MLTFVALFILSLLATNKVLAEMSLRQQTDNMPDFLMEEAILNSFVNSMSQIAEDQSSSSTVIEPILTPERDIGFFVFTRYNPNEPVNLKIGDRVALKNSNFSSIAPTKIIIHGWSDTGSSPWINEFRKNYLTLGDYNVVIIDWSAGSLREYLTSVRMSKQVGDYIVQVLEYLIMEGLTNPDNIHIMGHSLGAHIAGFIGDNLSEKLGRITGLDPARPDFEAPFLREPKDRLDPTDARFVDVIHTCAGTAGFVRPIGHVDFYPNGGTFRQPGCPVLMTQYCSHGRSHQFMSESIVNPTGFPAIQCNGWKEFKTKKCEENKIVYMGENLDQTTRGVFFLETNAEVPFGKGEL